MKITHTFKTTLIAFSVLCALSLQAIAAQPPTEPMVLTEADKADIKRVEDYLNNIGTMKARFMQMSSTGEMSEGDFFLSRPGKLRIDYDDPMPVLIVSNGIFLLYEDTQLDQKSYALLGSTPAAVLVKENVRLNGDDLAVTRIERGANVVRISLAQKDDPFSGVITLVFTDRPLMLRQWTIYDAQGTVTDFALLAPRFGIELDPALFEFSMKSKIIHRDK